VEGCALMDDFTRLQVLFRIVPPMAMPGVLTVVVFSFRSRGDTSFTR
jgi:ABC-type glycerol-3-phosphate transport system permease component